MLPPQTHGRWVATCGAEKVQPDLLVSCTVGVQVSPGGCRGEYEMTETSQMDVTASVCPRQPLSLIQDGADGVSPAQGSGLCSTLVDNNVGSLLVQNNLL